MQNLYEENKTGERECVWCAAQPCMGEIFPEGRRGHTILYAHFCLADMCARFGDPSYSVVCFVAYITFPGKVYGLAKVAQRLCLLVFSLPVELMEICTFMYF